MRKKIMISMPMNGKDFGSLVVEYHNYKRKLMEQDYCVVNSLFKAQSTNLEYMNNPVLCLSRAIKAMSKCDAVFFAKGWQNARGCKIEHEIAKAYGLEVIYETEPKTTFKKIACENSYYEYLRGN